MKLLAIFAHPDDEVFSCGGTLARYAGEGHQVYLICTTRGEEGEIIHPDINAQRYPKGEARGKLREEELDETCRALGIHPPIFLDYLDSGFPIEVGARNPRSFMNANLETLERQLLEHIAQIKPEVMIGFDPHGMYGHIDHITIHRAAIAAFWSAGGVVQPSPRRLFFPARSIEQLQQMKAAMRSTTLDNLDPQIYGFSNDSLAAIINIEAYAAKKRAGIVAHRSQVGEEARVDQMQNSRGDMFVQETFVLGGLRGGFPNMPVDDLLAGL